MTRVARELRGIYRPVEPYQRTDYAPGEIAQWDVWFPAVDIPVGFGLTARLPVWVGVLGYSRWITAQMVPSRQACDLLAAHWSGLEAMGGVPRLSVYDSEGAIGRRTGSGVQLSEGFQRFRGALGMGVHVLRPRHPEGKGVVERVNGYLETSFLPGRDFASVDDFNAQLADWLAQRANRRFHRGIRTRPHERIGADRQALRALPPVAPDTAWRHSVRVGRDHYVRFGTCDYSVHPKAIGSRVEICADPRWVVVQRGEQRVARHRRCLAPHQTITDPEHVRARRSRAEVPAPIAPAPELEVEVRDLSVCDALGSVGG